MFLYIINASSTSLYKIGFTRKNLKQRLVNLQTGSPFILDLVFSYKSLFAKEIEKVLHRNYSYLNTSGEWFYFDNVSVEEVKEKIIKIEETIKLIKEYEKSSDRY